MQPTKKLTPFLRDLIALVDDEATRNPEFAAKLEAIMAELPARPADRPRPPKTAVTLPDVFGVLQGRKGEAEFRFWVRTRSQSRVSDLLKAIIRSNGLLTLPRRPNAGPTPTSLSAWSSNRRWPA